MKLALCLFRFFPYGGLQRDFLRIMNACLAKGHLVTVYTMQWEGTQPEHKNLTINVIPPLFYDYTNHSRMVKFSKLLQAEFSINNYDLIVGFNKMPGLDIYYCADTCYIAKVAEQKTRLIRSFYQITSRYRKLSSLENSVFNNRYKTKILFLSEKERSNYYNCYQTKKTRSYLLPPNIDKNRFQPVISADQKLQIKHKISKELNLPISNTWLLMVGSGFKTKGVDRSIKLLKYLLDRKKNTDLGTSKNNINLIVIGQDNPDKFIKLAANLGVSNEIRFLLGREDIPDFMSVCDLLLHPAYRENTGTVILESIIMGLPVVASGICGYAKYITDSGCGEVISEPFCDENFYKTVSRLLTEDKRMQDLKNSGLKFREYGQIFSADEKIMKILDEIVIENQE